MRPSKFTDAQIKKAIVDVDGGVPLVTMCRTFGVTQTTFYRWRKKFGDIRRTEPSEIRVLRQENSRLKQLVADLYMEREFRGSLAATRRRKIAPVDGR